MRSKSLQVLLVSNMYPSDRHPRYGVFVKNFEIQLSDQGIKFSKIVLQDTKKVSLARKLTKYIYFYLRVIYSGLFQQEKHDLIYVHFPIYVSIPLFLISLFSRKPMVLNFHGNDLLPHTLLKQLFLPFQKYLMDRSACIVVPSQYYMRKIISEYNVAEDKIYVYPSGGIDPQLFKPFSLARKQEVRKELGYSHDSIIFGFVGNLIAGKGWKTLLESLRQIKEQGINIRCLMIGDGPDRKQILRILDKWSLTDIVELINSMPQQELVRYMNIFDLFIFPTVRQEESLGLVGIEAMACGCVVIGSDFAGLKDYCFDGQNSILFAAGDSSSLTQSIRKYLMLDGPAREKMKTNALDTSKEFQAVIVTKKLAFRLKELVSTGTPSVLR